MGRVPVSETESAYIAERIRAFDRESPETRRWLASYVAEFGALPIYLEWLETIGIRPDGAVIEWSTEGDYEGCREVNDVIRERRALVEAARYYPGLKPLIPGRPPEARTCKICGGLGFLAVAPQVYCNCGGVGWKDDRSTPSNSSEPSP